MKKYFILTGILAVAFGATGAVFASTAPPGSGNLPTSIRDCKNNGWVNYGDLFKNQGDCVSFVATEGKNLPSGSCH